MSGTEVSGPGSLIEIVETGCYGALSYLDERSRAGTIDSATASTHSQLGVSECRDCSDPL